MRTLTLGEVCTRTQREEELESLRTCGAFEKIDMEVKTNVDGAIGLEFRFEETLCWEPLKFRCSNVGLLEAIETDEDATDEELQRQYNERVRKAEGVFVAEGCREGDRWYVSRRTVDGQDAAEGKG